MLFYTAVNNGRQPKTSVGINFLSGLNLRHQEEIVRYVLEIFQQNLSMYTVGHIVLQAYLHFTPSALSTLKICPIYIKN